jgi:hypothetical protein
VEAGPLVFVHPEDDDGPGHEPLALVGPTAEVPFGPLSGGKGESLAASAREGDEYKYGIPSLRGELGLLPSLWLDASSFWEADCKEATFAGGIDWDVRGADCESCFELHA